MHAFFVLSVSFVLPLAQPVSAGKELPASPELAAALEHLTRALTHDEDEVRTYAVKAIDALGPYSKSAVPALTKLLERHPAHTEAIRVLGRFGADARESCPVLVRFLARGNEQARRSLIQIGPDPSSVPLLVQVLSSGDDEACGAAAAVLGSYGSAAKQAVPVLIELLGHRKSNLAGGAAYALGGIGRDAVPALLEAFAHATGDCERRLVLIALKEMGPEAADAVPVLRQALKKRSDNDKGDSLCPWLRVTLSRIESSSGNPSPRD